MVEKIMMTILKVVITKRKIRPRKIESDIDNKEGNKEDKGDNQSMREKKYDKDEVDREEERENKDDDKKSSFYDIFISYNYYKSSRCACTIINELMTIQQSLPYIKQNNS